MSKSIFASKTFWFNVGTALVAVGNGALGFALPLEYVIAISAVGNLILRYNTELPVHIVSE